MKKYEVSLLVKTGHVRYVLANNPKEAEELAIQQAEFQLGQGLGFETETLEIKEV